MGVMNEDRLTLYDGLIKTHITNTTVAKETGKGLSTNDYTTTEKNKLAGIADGANKTVVDSALNTSSTNPVQNKVIAGEINTLKKSVSDGKTLVATAITDKGVETAADATFAVMAENIGQIETGGGELHGATISVTTPEETLIGKTIKLSLNSTTVDTKTFDSNGACSFTDIQEAGTYSLYSTDGTDSATIPVDITAENVVNKTVISCEFYLTPDGETITPVDDVAILLKCAEIKDKSYTTMDELLADEQAMGDITMSENAMKYLARSTGFADAVCANETFMTLLGASPYVDATVLNSDLWKQAIKASQYWTLVYASKTVTVYGGAYETITIDGYYGSFTTGTDGSCSHVVPIDTITLTGSVSGQSFTRTVTSGTTEVKVMPEGALYWYGNECTDKTGGWSIFSGRSQTASSFGEIVKNTNYIQTNQTTNNIYDGIVSKNKIDFTKYNALKSTFKFDTIINSSHIKYLMITSSDFIDGNVFIGNNIFWGTNLTNRTEHQYDFTSNITTQTCALKNYPNEQLYTYNCFVYSSGKMYAIWLE